MVPITPIESTWSLVYVRVGTGLGAQPVITPTPSAVVERRKSRREQLFVFIGVLAVVAI
jgi:hypothetical protein